VKSRKYGSMHVGANKTATKEKCSRCGSVLHTIEECGMKRQQRQAPKTAFKTKVKDPMALPWRDQIENFLADVEALRVAHMIEHVKIEARTTRISRDPRRHIIVPGIERELSPPPYGETVINETKLQFPPKP
jgi:hypothetical protein